jgi:hypothetical protein
MDVLGDEVVGDHERVEEEEEEEEVMMRRSPICDQKHARDHRDHRVSDKP